MSSYSPTFEGFIAPARTRPQIWRLILGFLIAFAIFAVVTIAVLAGGIWLAAPDTFVAQIRDWTGTPPHPMERELARMMSGQSPTHSLVILATFIGMVLGAWAAARWLHGRRFGTLLGPLNRVARHFGLAALVAAPVLALGFVLPPQLNPLPHTALSIWLTFLPLALALLAIQTGAEELFFRGYLQQQLAARFRSPIFWMVLPSLLFGMAHFSPGQFGGSAWAVVGVTTIFGLLAADLTARTGSLGAAWGLHFANNISAMLFISLEGPLAGMALYVVPEAALTTQLLYLALVQHTILIGVIWLILRKLLAR